MDKDYSKVMSQEIVEEHVPWPLVSFARKDLRGKHDGGDCLNDDSRRRSD